MQLSNSEFELLRGHVRRICGLTIPNGKEYLVSQRLEPVAVRNKCGTFMELCERLKSGGVDGLEDQIICAITTNETSFFRDIHPYETFKTRMLPLLDEAMAVRRALSPQGAHKVSIWSAASSTGQEPYSIAITIHEHVEANKHKGKRLDEYQVMASDISTAALEKAKSGQYSDFEIKRGMPETSKSKYFTREGPGWRIARHLQSLVEFRRLNLLSPPSWLGRYDMIFCRNVLIYFDDASKALICGMMHQMLNPGGIFLLGASENLLFLKGTGVEFDSIREGETIYYKKPRK